MISQNFICSCSRDFYRSFCPRFLPMFLPGFLKEIFSGYPRSSVRIYSEASLGLKKSSPGMFPDIVSGCQQEFLLGLKPELRYPGIASKGSPGVPVEIYFPVFLAGSFPITFHLEVASGFLMNPGFFAGFRTDYFPVFFFLMCLLEFLLRIFRGFPEISSGVPPGLLRKFFSGISPKLFQIFYLGIQIFYRDLYRSFPKVFLRFFHRSSRRFCTNSCWDLTVVPLI